MQDVAHGLRAQTQAELFVWMRIGLTALPWRFLAE